MSPQPRQVGVEAHQFHRISHLARQERSHGFRYTQNRACDVDPAANVLVDPVRAAIAAVSSDGRVCFHPLQARSSALGTAYAV